MREKEGGGIGSGWLITLYIVNSYIYQLSFCFALAATIDTQLKFVAYRKMSFKWS